MSSLLETVSNNLSLNDRQVTRLLFTVHDWLAHLTDHEFILPSYGTSLGIIIHEKIQECNYPVSTWVDLTVGQEASSKTLLYRHYLFEVSSNEEIFLDVNFSPLYILFGSMYYRNVRYSLLEDRSVWDNLEEVDKPVINLLRLYRPIFHNQAIELANRKDVTDCSLDRDHGLLSSHSLLYSLNLIRVILIYEQTIGPDISIQSVLDAITQTLTALKGAVFHVKD